MIFGFFRVSFRGGCNKSTTSLDFCLLLTLVNHHEKNMNPTLMALLAAPINATPTRNKGLIAGLIKGQAGGQHPLAALKVGNSQSFFG